MYVELDMTAEYRVTNVGLGGLTDTKGTKVVCDHALVRIDTTVVGPGQGERPVVGLYAHCRIARERGGVDKRSKVKPYKLDHQSRRSLLTVIADQTGNAVIREEAGRDEE